MSITDRKLEKHDLFMYFQCLFQVQILTFSKVKESILELFQVQNLGFVCWYLKQQ